MKSRLATSRRETGMVGGLLLFVLLGTPGAFGTESSDTIPCDRGYVSDVDPVTNNRPSDREMIRPPVIPRIPPR